MQRTLSHPKRLMATLLAIILATAGFLAVKPAPANAAFSDCPVNFGCLFSGANGGGVRLTIAYGSHHFNCWNLPEGGLADNDAESAVNRYGSNIRMTFYTNHNCVEQNGYSYTLNNGYQVTWLVLNHMANDVSSYLLSPGA